jgi:hypothetical protein
MSFATHVDRHLSTGGHNRYGAPEGARLRVPTRGYKHFVPTGRCNAKPPHGPKHPRPQNQRPRAKSPRPKTKDLKTKSLIRIRSLTPQCHQRINFSGASGGDERGDHSHSNQCKGDNDECEPVSRCYAEKQCRQEPREQQCPTQSQCNSRECQDNAVFQHERQDIRRLRSECDTYSQLTCALTH